MAPPKTPQEPAKKRSHTANRRRARRANQRQQNPSPSTPAAKQASPMSSVNPSTAASSVSPSQLENHSTGPQVAAQQHAYNDDYLLLLKPEFSAMTRITDHLFLTGVGGMTRSNFRKNHIDFVVNITTEAPFWEDIESMRVPLEDDPNALILPYLDTAVDRIHEAITQKSFHVLVHCVAGVSRSAAVVIAYLMKYRRMTLRDAFNYCYNLRPVIRPNNGFMVQLINYEIQLFGRNSVYMIDANVDGTLIHIPHFFIEDHHRLIMLEVLRVREQQRLASIAAYKSTGEEKNKQTNPRSPDD